MSMTVTAETVHNSSTISSSESLAASPFCPPHSATRAGAPPAAPAASPSCPPHAATRAGAPPAAPGAPAAPPKAAEPAPSTPASSGGVRDRGSTTAPAAPPKAAEPAPSTPASSGGVRDRGSTAAPAPSTPASSGGVRDRGSTAVRGGKCRMKSCDHSLHSRSFGSAAGPCAGRSFGSSVPTRGCRHQIETSDVPTHAAHDRRHGFSQATA